jgi:hypothetical protein
MFACRRPPTSADALRELAKAYTCNGRMISRTIAARLHSRTASELTPIRRVIEDQRMFDRLLERVG